MGLKAVEVMCTNGECSLEGEKVDKIVKVSRLNEIGPGTRVDEECRECHQQLMVALSAPRLSLRGGRDHSENGSEGQAHEHNGNCHLHAASANEPETEIAVFPERGVAFLTTEVGSASHRKMEENGTKPRYKKGNKVAYQGAIAVPVGLSRPVDRESDETLN